MPKEGENIFEIIGLILLKLAKMFYILDKKIPNSLMVELSEKDKALFIELLTFPEKDRLLSQLRKFSHREDLFIVGGAVRDFLLSKRITDLDIAVKYDIYALYQYLAEVLSFSPVPLSEEFGIYRLAKGGYTLDLTLYRGETIEEDLRERDFTFNAMAIPLEGLFEGPFYLYDPFYGYSDLQKGIIRALGEENIKKDPLRILRGYRFYALNYGYLEEKTRVYFQNQAQKLLLIAPERLSMELKYVLISDKAYLAFKAMDEDRVLEILFPEIIPAKGLPQPSFHHLDVFAHSLEALKWSEIILKEPKKYLGLNEIPEIFNEEDFVIAVKLGSFLHDLGKGYTYDESEERITFYGHESKGAELWIARAKALRFKNEIADWVFSLIKNHMRPCHLLKEWENKTLSARAKRNLLKAHSELFSLWIVAMADSLASRGPDKEKDYEEKLKAFFKDLLSFQQDLERVEKRERLITGKDLIAIGFKPGPLFKEILEEVEIKAIEGVLKTKNEAISYVLERYRKELPK